MTPHPSLPRLPGTASVRFGLSAALVLAALALLLVPVGAPASATTPLDDTTVALTLPSTDSVTATTENEFTDLDRELSECVGSSVEKPGCGRRPTHSGDRGSGMQWAVFAIMTAGIAFIGWRIVRGARRRPSLPA